MRCKMFNRRIRKAIGGDMGELSPKALYYLEHRKHRHNDEARRVKGELGSFTGVTYNYA